MSKMDIPPFEKMPPVEIMIDDQLSLRLFNPEDAHELAELASNEAVRQFVPWAKRVNDEDSALLMIEDFLGAWERGVMARYAVESSGNFVGYTGIWPDKEPGYYEFGFAMLPNFRDQGIGSRVAQKLLDTLKDELQATGVVAYVDDSNLASKAVVVKLGMRPTDEFDDGDRRYIRVFSE